MATPLSVSGGESPEDVLKRLTNKPAEPSSPSSSSPSPSPVSALTRAPQTAPVSTSVPLDEYTLTVTEFTTGGELREFRVPLPNSPDFDQWSVMQQVAMLKKGAWNKSPVSEIMFAIAYARKCGLDIMEGDVYSTGEGRIAKSNKAKIKTALKTGKVKGWEHTITDTGKPWNSGKCTQATDLICTVTLDIEGLTKPIVRTGRLSEWYIERNPNWRDRPFHMLELSTFAHACERVDWTTLGPEEDAPPADSSPTITYTPSPALAGIINQPELQAATGAPVPLAALPSPTVKDRLESLAPTLDYTFPEGGGEEVGGLLASLKSDVSAKKQQ